MLMFTCSQSEPGPKAPELLYLDMESKTPIEHAINQRYTGSYGSNQRSNILTPLQTCSSSRGLVLLVVGLLACPAAMTLGPRVHASFNLSKRTQLCFKTQRHQAALIACFCCASSLARFSLKYGRPCLGLAMVHVATSTHQISS
ncbi:uncharacterized protein H6S33_009059 [Morchella sextelata]|uniref:uncharacterized protein n=1 Tax=Morchella sextelata TaxID=1174677 RepID=UPI001D041BF3|nr:uncharacterized protein H6S33_009059 [Morchella sextelata]KAH0612679.1 hypothetical protein H6S33_009059 [Morchella sextelata]